MRSSGCFFLIFLLLFSSQDSFSSALSEAEVSFIAHRQLLSLPENGDLPENYEYQVDVNLTFPNARLRRAYIALQAWKEAIVSDPHKITTSWVGADVCDYKGVFCAPAPDDPKSTVVAGVDLNNADLAGFLPVELGLMSDLALFHVNSNRFCGIIPQSFSKMAVLYEFDVSNNRLVGPFPMPVTAMPALKYLDLRYNDFEGSIPPELFDMDLDAVFLNNNRFQNEIPENLGNSPASVIVFANNRLTGCIPHSIKKMENTLNEIIFTNNKLTGCLPMEIGSLENLTVFAAASNSLSGVLPKSFSGIKSVELIDISNNFLTGFVPEGICKLPNLVNFTFSYNYFRGESPECESSRTKDVVVDDTDNCFPDRPKQKASKTCTPVVNRPVDCGKSKCVRPSLPTPSRPHKPKPTPDVESSRNKN
ncbi:PREDICTED: pollen-specific leucine-rich repeat extensin-like protein 3 [Nelumbo nucifera]|uniref:Cell wall hydroxyproline-rich glycoprotein n=1 Tax=Nelumbo nucifera TaxID=4432 RepID=A0A1U8Q206_NELNU|nr:PREDICTED: pollen-specific leucine-rich repeat extensin-like protein 3 [Nelumbo nucifera]